MKIFFPSIGDNLSLPDLDVALIHITQPEKLKDRKKMWHSMFESLKLIRTVIKL